MKIRVTVEGTSLTATLDDTETARDVAALHGGVDLLRRRGPLTVTIERMAE